MIKLKDILDEKLYNSQGEGYTFGKGDIVKDINPDCPHHGAEGEVIKGGKLKITFRVTNNGKNYKEGDELEKTTDQMVKLNSDEIKEGKLSEVNKAQEVLKHITGGSPSRVGNLPNMGNYVYQEKNGITFGLDKPINKVKVVQIVQTKPDNYDVYFKTDAKKVKKKVKNVEGRMLTSILMKHALKR